MENESEDGSVSLKRERRDNGVPISLSLNSLAFRPLIPEEKEVYKACTMVLQREDV